jgi:hypothetical protein
MVYLQTKNPNLGKIWSGKGWKILWPFEIYYGHLVHFMAIWYILCPLGNIAANWYILPSFGILCHEKSGNPALGERHLLAFCLLFFAKNIHAGRRS